MESNRNRYLVVGGVLWIALIILVGGMLFLNEKDPRLQMVSYYTWFPQVSTLNKGDPVKVNGVKVGKVKAIELQDRRVRVEISVWDSVAIPRNSQVRVQNIGLLGERQVGILMGDGSDFLKPGDQVDGRFDAGISEAMGYAGEVFDSARVLLSIVRTVVDSTVGDPAFQQSFRRIVSDAEVLEQRLGGMMDKTEPEMMTSLRNLRTASVKLNSLLDTTRAPVVELLADAGHLTQGAQGLLGKADALADRMDRITARLEKTDNTMGALLQDEAFYRDLNQTLGSADSLLRIIIDDGLDINVDFF